MAIDTRTYEMRHRVSVQFGLRDLQRDPDSGDLYTCSEIFGDVFRIDRHTLRSSRVGWCGRLCRGLYVDSAAADPLGGDPRWHLPLPDRASSRADDGRSASADAQTTPTAADA